MRLSAAKKVHYESGPNMIPMVDIVMVILIFLMLTGTFAGGTHFLTSNLPLSQRGTGPATGDQIFRDPEVEVNVSWATDATGERVFVASVGDRRIVGNPDELVSVLRARYNQMKDVAMANPQSKDKEVQLIITPAKSTHWKVVIQVYEAANEAGFKKIAFAAGTGA